jgi:hypothetical protein
VEYREVSLLLAFPTPAVLSFFFFFLVLGLELRAYTLSHSTSLFVKGFLELGSHYLPRLALNRNPPDLCLLSS